MGCYSCGGNPNTFCRDCTYPKDTWIAPVDSLPDPFMGDFDHLFRTPDGNMYALAPDRSSWILMGGAGGAVQKPQNLELDNGTRELTITRGNTVTLPNDTQNLSINGRTITISNGNAINLPEDRDTVYNDAELRRRIQAVEDKADNFVSGVTVSREGNKVKLTYTFVNGAPKEVEFEDKDTITLAYDDTALKARVKALEDKPDKDTVYDDRDLKARIADLEARPLTDEPLAKRVSVLEAKRDNDNQTLSISNNRLTISNGNSVDIPQPDLSNYVTVNQYNELKDAFTKLLEDLKGSGAWEQTGDTIFKGNLKPNRHLATGNINLFGGQPDGDAFIRTNNSSTENDLTGGI